MQRKWMILAATMISVSALAAGMSLADDEDSPLKKLMEKVNSKSNAVKKAVRTGVAYKKAQANNELVTNGKELIKLAKESRDLAKEGAKKAKNVQDPEKKWVELSDAFTKQLEKFVAKAGEPDTDQAAAKSAFGVVSQSCTDCHNVFRVEDEKF